MQLKIFSAFILGILPFFQLSAQDTSGKSTAFKKIKMPATNTFILPDGRVVGAEKIDSVDKAWGGKGLIFSHKNDPGDKRIFLLPKTDAFVDQQLKNQKSLEELLNSKAPEFSLKDLTGKRYTLSRMKGKIVVLNFYFRACAPCIAEMPDLNAVKKQYNNEKIVFLAAALDKPEELRNFLSKNRFDFVSLPDAKNVHRAFRVNVCPTTIIIDQQGDIRYIIRESKTVKLFISNALESLLTPTGGQ